MSVAALTIAFRAKLGKSSTKSVFVALADRADDVTGICFPSVADIVERTELDRKTVLSCLKELERRKFLLDTGKRCGKTNQVKIWRLDLALIKQTSEKPHQNGNGSDFSSKLSRISEQPVPKSGYGTPCESSSNHHLEGHTGGEGDEVNSESPGVVWHEDELRGSLEEFISAAHWMQLHTGGFRSSPVKFKSAVRKRIRSNGPNPEDWETFRLWRASHSQLEAAANPEETKLAAERKQRLASVRQRYEEMATAEQKATESRFAAYLQATNAQVNMAYRLSGLESKMVSMAFYEWLAGELK